MHLHGKIPYAWTGIYDNGATYYRIAKEAFSLFWYSSQAAVFILVGQVSPADIRITHASKWGFPVLLYIVDYLWFNSIRMHPCIYLIINI